ncbi:MAG: helix-turn-helix transcriptional regulator [Oligosphaeraceae bacterium]|nr:helix-turn-helix transcriptional regulator [Oligosphaeraceae bacterium]
MAEISPRLRQVRSVLRKSQREFAALLGISLSHYSKLEAGIGGVSDAVLYAVAAQAGVSPEWLKTGQGLPPAGQEAPPRRQVRRGATAPPVECISAVIAAAERPELRALAEKMSALTGVSVVQALADLLLASRRSLPLTEKDQQEGSGDVGKP